MSSMLSAPATIPATRQVTFSGAFAPPSPAKVRCWPTKSDKPARSANASARGRPGAGHQIRVVERCGQVGEIMRNSHPADDPSVRVNRTLVSPILPHQKGVRVSRPATAPNHPWIQAEPPTLGPRRREHALDVGCAAGRSAVGDAAVADRPGRRRRQGPHAPGYVTSCLVSQPDSSTTPVPSPCGYHPGDHVLAEVLPRIRDLPDRPDTPPTGNPDQDAGTRPPGASSGSPPCPRPQTTLTANPDRRGIASKQPSDSRPADLGQRRRGPPRVLDAVFDEASGTWVSRAEVTEITFTAFSSKKRSEKVPGRSSCAPSRT